jgi:tetratricopeptide (TPR) repeat protein
MLQEMGISTHVPVEIAMALKEAVRLHARGDLAGAEMRYKAILREQPRSFDALHFLGVLRSQQGAHIEALDLILKALELKPASPQAHANLGLALRKLGRFEEALASLDLAVELAPNDPAAHNSRGNALLGIGRIEEALASFEAAIALKPEFVEAINNRGNALRRLKRFEEALASYERAYALRPDHIPTLNNRGVALQDLKRLSEALSDYDRALQIDPRNVEALINRGLAHIEMQKPQEARELFERALAIAPNHPQAHYSLGWCALLMGDFERGWSEYEWRWRRRGAPRPKFEGYLPEWKGEDPQGKKIIVFEEQGLGDVIQFSRYLPVLARAGAEVVFLVAAPLHRLLRSLSPDIALVDTPPEEAGFDYRCALMSLPGRLKNAPPAAPYLREEPDLAAKWRAIIGDRGFTIGVCWQGDPDSENDIARFAPLQYFAPLAKIPGVRLISLQKRHGLEQLPAFLENAAIEILEPFDDGPDAFIDAAAVMSGLDLIVTVDTSIAHLAGALGRPTFLALKYAPDWRWGLDRTDSPWYPTLKLFRQSERRDWGEVFEAIAEDIAKDCAAPAALLHIPGSIGELYDKITILEIKTKRISDPAKLKNIFKELELLRGLERDHPLKEAEKALVAELKRLNETIWESEEGLRACERDSEFGPDFVDMARNVYKSNDARAALKQRLNKLKSSPLLEEKSHEAGGPAEDYAERKKMTGTKAG